MTPKDARRIENLLNWLGGMGGGLLVGTSLVNSRGFATVVGFVLLGVALIGAMAMALSKRKQSS